MRLLGTYYDKLPQEDRLFVNHIADMVELCEKKYIVRFSSFLDIRQAELAKSVLNRMEHDNYMFYGGYENALRTVLGVFPTYSECDAEEFPIKALAFRYRESDKLSHRDFLGSFMGCRIGRNMIGDIIVNDGYTVAFVYDTVCGTICSDVRKIGSVGVKISLEDSPEINVNEKFEEISGTVSSMRADCVVSTAVRLSREKSAQLIRAGNLTVNCEVMISVSSELKEKDIFSVRGFGKFVIDEISGKTKKDRLHIKIKKYI